MYNVAQIYCIDKTINAINLEFKTVKMTEKQKDIQLKKTS